MPGHYGNGNGGRNRRMATTRNQPTRRNLGTNGNAINENPVTRLFNAPRSGLGEGVGLVSKSGLGPGIG